MAMWHASIRQRPTGLRPATRLAAWRGVLARIGSAVLETGEHLRPPLSTVCAVTDVCDRLAMWAESDDRCPPDPDFLESGSGRNADALTIASGGNGPEQHSP
jgi:hypothetical protein